MEQKNMNFTVYGDNGEEITCDVLFTFDSEETGKSYIVYTDNSVDDNGSVNVFASIYQPDSNDSRLYPIETEKEWHIIETILKELQDEIGNPDS